ncbi:hypothetical protein ABZX95_06175 [Streptomyces sp. NPDC004232]|uniref:hypothetical protein n=1 Tax=Streptomyces sp. NPDC004232 TaxID=3154454 RepID=UPI0033BF583E
MSEVVRVDKHWSSFELYMSSPIEFNWSMTSENTPNSDELGNEAGSSRAQSVATSWRDPEVRERRQAAMRASSRSQETVERRSTAQREKWRLARERLVTCFVCGRGPEQADEGTDTQQ